MKFFRCQTSPIVSNRIEETSDEHLLPVARNDGVGVGDVTDGETLGPVLHLPWGLNLTVSARDGEGRVAVSHDLALLADVGQVHAVVDPAGSVRSQLQPQRVIQAGQGGTLRQTLGPHLHTGRIELE